MSTKKKTKTKSVRDLSRPEKIDILKRVAANESVREIAKEYGLRYPSIRHVVISEWKASFPQHFEQFAFPETISTFKAYTPSAQVKSKPIKNTHAADGIPDVVKEMIAKDGLYIGKDPFVADAIVPMFVRKGIIYSMRIDKALELDGFLVGTEISGPFNA